MNPKSAINTSGGNTYRMLPDLIFIAGIKAIAVRINGQIKLMKQARAERQQMARMTTRRLNDIGINAGAASQEVARSYFYLPPVR